MRPQSTLDSTLSDTALFNAVGGHPLVSQLLIQRGFDTPKKALAFLHPESYAPSAATKLYGLSEAAELLQCAISEEQNILVWGDFDVDGQTSTSLLVAGLRTLYDAEFPQKKKTRRHKNRVRFHVPNRFNESHGIKPEYLRRWLDDKNWQPHVLLTCDTGVAEDEAINLAKDRGLTVIITDHHDLPDEFANLTPGIDPLWGLDQNGQADLQHDEIASNNRVAVRRADAIINPKFQPLEDPLRTLPGVGVAYKLMQHLFALAGHAGEEKALLDLVSLGIVADVAEQVNDVRYLLQLGLEQLRNTKRVGLLALMDVAGVTVANVSEDHIGFQIGPRMNALGRLEDATDSVELLTTTDETRARELAGKLNRLNQERRLLTSQITQAAQEMIARQPDLLNYNGLVLAHPAWHPGIVGIVASQLAEEFNKPTVLLLTPPGESARGSARSIDGVDIGGSIAACSHLLRTHGGHPGAAGVSLLPENIDAFRRELDRQILLHTTGEQSGDLIIDAELNFADINLDLLEEIQRLAPFGSGNLQPIFMSRTLQIVNDSRMGHEQQHRKFIVQQHEGGPSFPVLWFNDGAVEFPSSAVDLAYKMNINEYRGNRSIQFIYVGVRPSKPDATVLAADVTSSTRRTLRDMRFQQVVASTLPTDHAVWYAEGLNLPDSIPFAPRTQIDETAETLVLWSIPPSAQLLNALLEMVEPQNIYLCAQQTHEESASTILRTIGSMCKFTLENGCVFDLPKASAKLAITTETTRHGLRWLTCKGLIALDEWINDNEVRISSGNGSSDDAKLANTMAALEHQLEETRAFRRFYRRAKLADLGIG